MFHEIDSSIKQRLTTVSNKSAEDSFPINRASNNLAQVEARRLFYERIAQGNAIAEIEERGRRKRQC